MYPEIRNYMYPHYGTGYMPYPYGTHIGYGHSVPLSVYHHYHPYIPPLPPMIHQLGGSGGATFSVPIQTSGRLVM